MYRGTNNFMYRFNNTTSLWRTHVGPLPLAYPRKTIPLLYTQGVACFWPNANWSNCKRYTGSMLSFFCSRYSMCVGIEQDSLSGLIVRLEPVVCTHVEFVTDVRLTHFGHGANFYSFIIAFFMLWDTRTVTLMARDGIVETVIESQGCHHRWRSIVVSQSKL